MVDAEQAKAICAGCPVRLDCLIFALEANQQFGIWGGYDEEERRELRRRRRTKFRALAGEFIDELTGSW